MGGEIDRFVVRLVIAMTVLSWGSVLAHDVLNGSEPAESVHATSAPEEGGAVKVPPSPVASNTTPPGNDSGHDLALVLL